MLKKIKRIFNNRPWKAAKTRKIVLFLSVVVVLAYIIASMIFATKGIELDSTLTDNVFDFFKWLVVTGCAITVAKVVKGNTNSDNDEDLME